MALSPGAACVMSLPSSSIRPSSTGWNPRMVSRRSVFPAPVGPRRTKYSPSPTSRSMSLSSNPG